jgi:hypothetical protein
MAGAGGPNKDREFLHAESATKNSIGIDYNFRSQDLGEVEHILGNTVTDHRRIPSSRQALVDYEVGLNGWNELIAFHMRFGCKLDADPAPEDADDRIGVGVALKGSSERLLKGKRHENSPERRVVFTSDPPRTLRFSEDCPGYVSS